MTSRRYYLRFVVAGGEGQRGNDGIFVLAYDLKRGAALAVGDAELLQELLTWFENHLALPDRFSRTRSKGRYRRHALGLSWLKPEAREAIRKMRVLAKLLGRHGNAVEELRALRPGFVVYEDDWQVVAEPFAETPT